MKTIILILLFIISGMLAMAQSHKVILVTELKNSNCTACMDCLLTEVPVGSLQEAYNTEKNLRKQHGFSPGIYILKPGEGAVIYEFDKEVGNCRCRVIRVMYQAGKTAQDAVDALNREKQRNPELRNKTISIRQTWPVDLMQKEN